MKTTLRLSIAAFGLAIFTVSTVMVKAEDFTYTTNNGTITLTRYIGPGGDVSIPSTINGLPVTSIGGQFLESGIWQGAFQSSGVTSVTIPNSVTSIGSFAFSRCDSLTNVTIGNSVTFIGSGAFQSCGSLQSVIIPNSVTGIGGGAFNGCNNLSTATLSSNLTSLEGGVFMEGEALRSIVIPNGVTNIGYGAFRWCYSLTNVTIPSKVISIGGNAFSGCSSLTGVTIPSSVTNIEDNAFHDCTSLTNLTINPGVIAIGAQAFQNCTSLISVTIPNTVTKIGDRAFDARSLTGVYFEGDVPTLACCPFTTNTTIYYLPGTIGWGSTFAERPTAPWLLTYPVILTTASNFGVQTNAFGFRISWATNASVVVEVSTTLASPLWSPLSTNALAGGWCDFRDAEWTQHPARFYRVRQW